MSEDRFAGCITFVQLHGTLVIGGHYTVGERERSSTVPFEFRMPALLDATDPDMWMQMMAAKLCDSL
jgi:hypothetical protein